MGQPVRSAFAACGRLWDGGGRELATAVGIPFLVQRTLLVLAVGFGCLLLPHEPGWHAVPEAVLLDGWLRWDSGPYLLIATDGYVVNPRVDPRGFFPLYPWLMRALGWLMPMPWAALLVANAAALATLTLLYALARDLYDETLARRSVWVLLLFPTSFFLSAGYSESVYLACAIGAVLAWRKERHLWAAVAACGAVMARPIGIFAFTIPFAVGWLARGHRRQAIPWWTLGALAGAGAVLVTYQLSVGDPFGFLASRQVQALGVYHDKAAPSHWAVLLDEGAGPNLMRRLLNWSAIVLVTVTSFVLLRRREVELGLIAALSLAVPLYFHDTLFDAASMARYTLASFPIFFVLARWLPEGNRGRAYDLGAQMFQIVLAILFATWRWAE